MPKSVMAAMASLLLAGTAHAGVIDLGIGGANVFTAGNFTGSNNGTSGAIVAGGNVSVNSFGVNKDGKTAYDGYAVVAGGKLSVSNGSVSSGKIYAGGGSDYAVKDKTGVSNSTVLPLTFSATAANALAVSTELDTLATTGSFVSAYGGMTLTGHKNMLEVFDLKASDLSAAGWLNTEGIAAGATVIVNVSGAANGVIRSLGKFENVNVLYNFVDALALEFSNIGLAGSMLAPKAAITGGNGSIGGNVVAGSWDATLTLSGLNYFKAVDAVGYDLAPTRQVPEPSSLLLVAVGLAAAAVFSARRKSARSKP